MGIKEMYWSALCYTVRYHWSNKKGIYYKRTFIWSSFGFNLHQIKVWTTYIFNVFAVQLVSCFCEYFFLIRIISLIQIKYPRFPDSPVGTLLYASLGTLLYSFILLNIAYKSINFTLKIDFKLLQKRQKIQHV